MCNSKLLAESAKNTGARYERAMCEELMAKKSCTICGNNFETRYALNNPAYLKRQTCGRECSNIEKQSRTPWNKNRKGIINVEGKNGMWKGDAVGYVALHAWVRARKLKPHFCEYCNNKPAHDLANISQQYKRELSDWEWLCRKCHMGKDGRLANLAKFREMNIGRIKRGVTGRFERGKLCW